VVKVVGMAVEIEGGRGGGMGMGIGMGGRIYVCMAKGIAEGMMRGMTGRMASWHSGDRTVGSWWDDCRNGCQDGCPEAQCTSTVNKGVEGMDELQGWMLGWR
jgi:hypothetical protein